MSRRNSRYRHLPSRLNRAGEWTLILGAVLVGVGGFFHGLCILIGGGLMMLGGALAFFTDRRTSDEKLRDTPEN